MIRSPCVVAQRHCLSLIPPHAHARTPPNPHPCNSFLLAAALLLALVGAVNAQSADGLESYKRAAQEYLAQAQGLATKYGAQAGDVAKVRFVAMLGGRGGRH